MGKIEEFYKNTQNALPHKNVLEFRRGKYGEGENGVTIAELND